MAGRLGFSMYPFPNNVRAAKPRGITRRWCPVSRGYQAVTFESMEADLFGTDYRRVIGDFDEIDMFVWIHAICTCIGKHAFPEIGPVLVCLGRLAPLGLYKCHIGSDISDTYTLAPVVWFCPRSLAKPKLQLSPDGCSGYAGL